VATITYRWQGNGIAKLTAAADALAGPKKTAALRRALNRTGDMTFTRVKRALANQIGTTQAIIMRYGRVRRIRASNALLEYQIVSRGGPIPLRHFKPRQGAKGTTAAPWRNRKLYRGAFIVASMGGNVFWREGKSRLPIKKIAGPNVPKELVKDESAVAFDATVRANLQRRVEHEVRAITNGVVS
jgi:hypothetical protein